MVFGTHNYHRNEQYAHDPPLSSQTARHTTRRLSARLRHITLAVEGEETVHVWLDDAGRLMKVEIPSRHLIAERFAGS